MAHLRGSERARYVEAMFSRISRRYDLLNTVMTGGMHYHWRRLAVRLADSGSKGPALDVATGTGDFIMELIRRSSVTHVFGLDFSLQMLKVARIKAQRLGTFAKTTLVGGDALHLPFPDNTFVSITTGFSLRNIIDVPQALREMARVTRSGGQVAVLETTPVRGKGPFPRLFGFYFRRVVPWVGAILAGDREAYTYLPESASAFHTPEELAKLMSEAGWADVRFRKLGMGTVAIHTGRKTQ